MVMEYENLSKNKFHLSNPVTNTHMMDLNLHPDSRTWIQS
ncbi:MAG: hypothetical protein BWY06_02849 [Candidatus Latescibacteria bacterium ADurb.Bin168]|nr:MAG: hypothetical protein BWY06_02849 [Candidatus Latescibacteria bacterium ADurb.Bin168]